MKNINPNKLKRSLAIVVVVLFWLLTPLYVQIEHDYSAINISFGITVFYYLAFKLWMRNKSEGE